VDVKGKISTKFMQIFEVTVHGFKAYGLFICLGSIFFSPEDCLFIITKVYEVTTNNK
jgi:hypothetical protein